MPRRARTVDRRAGTPREANVVKELPSVRVSHRQPDPTVSGGFRTEQGQLLRRADSSRRDLDKLMQQGYPRRGGPLASARRARRRCLAGVAGSHWTAGGPTRPRWRRTLLPREVSAMTHGDSLALTVQATQRSLEERLGEALVPHRDPLRPRDHYAATDTFLAATSRHLAAVEAVLVDQVRRTVPDGQSLGHEYLHAARRLEQTLALIKGRLYGEAFAIHQAWPDLWDRAQSQLGVHNGIENRMVELLILHGDPVAVDGLARRMFDVEAHGPTRPHPRTPHTGLLGLAARRMWALADHFWDAAEGRVIPEPVRRAPHRHDSLMAQYLVADPKFDADATIVEHHHRHRDAG